MDFSILSEYYQKIKTLKTGYTTDVLCIIKTIQSKALITINSEVYFTWFQRQGISYLPKMGEKFDKNISLFMLRLNLHLRTPMVRPVFYEEKRTLFHVEYATNIYCITFHNIKKIIINLGAGSHN